MACKSKTKTVSIVKKVGIYDFRFHNFPVTEPSASSRPVDKISFGGFAREIFRVPRPTGDRKDHHHKDWLTTCSKGRTAGSVPHLSTDRTPGGPTRDEVRKVVSESYSGHPQPRRRKLTAYEHMDLHCVLYHVRAGLEGKRIDYCFQSCLSFGFRRGHAGETNFLREA